MKDPRKVEELYRRTNAHFITPESRLAAGFSKYSEFCQHVEFENERDNPLLVSLSTKRDLARRLQAKE